MPDPREQPKKFERERAEDIPGLERTTLCPGRKFEFAQVAMTLPTGERLVRQYVRHPGAVVILARLDGANGASVLLVRNRRLALGKFILELPAGTRDHPGETPQATAERELEEEAGYRAATWMGLGRFYTGPGLTDELMHAFFARDLTHVGQKLEEDEEMSVVACPVRETLAMIERGEIMDGKSIATILMGERRGLLR